MTSLLKSITDNTLSLSFLFYVTKNKILHHEKKIREICEGGHLLLIPYVLEKCHENGVSKHFGFLGQFVRSICQLESKLKLG